ncbi:hypothetical protein I4U23_000348 [Adineta vaga]|nr:hypothetical protein I4U23_000348 [Adineta vaga]
MYKNVILYLAISYNQPKFCSVATWHPDASTFADVNTIGSYPQGVFVNTTNTIFVTDQHQSKIVIWNEDSPIPIGYITGNLSQPYSSFVTTSNDIYIDSFDSTGQVGKWTSNLTFDNPVMYTGSNFYSLFVDIANTIYCSLNDISNTISIVAGSVSSSVKLEP